MRSVLVYLQNATEIEVAAYLSRTYPFQVAPPWIYDKNDDPVLYIDFYRDMNTEMEVEQWLLIMEHFEGEPSVSVIADISGRHSGAEEVKAFVCDLLHKFGGVAGDDYTFHLWTREQIQENVLVEGHPFFDYQGWYEQE